MKAREKENRQVIGTGEKIFNVSMCILGVLITIISLYPIYYVVIASISNPLSVDSGDVIYKSVGVYFDSYLELFADEAIWTGYANTLFYTIVGTLVNMVASTTLAYALANKKLVGRKYFTMLAVFTMWFDAGLIPTYLNMKDLGLLDSRASIVIGFAISTYNVIILKSFFEQLPEALGEAAYMDGANNVMTFWKIMLPLSKPALATVAVFYAVNRWNGYFWAMMYLKDTSKAPLQLLLKRMIVDRTMNAAEASIVTVDSVTSPTTMIYATIVIAIIPMLFIFPFIQRYFKTGITVGGVKG